MLNLFFFFFNDTATTEIYTLSLHDALPIYRLLPLGRARSLARLGACAGDRVPAGTLRGATPRALPLRLRARERPLGENTGPLPRPPRPQRSPPGGRVLPADPRVRAGGRLAPGHLRDLALRRMGRRAPRAGPRRSLGRDRPGRGRGARRD